MATKRATTLIKPAGSQLKSVLAYLVQQQQYYDTSQALYCTLSTLYCTVLCKVCTLPFSEGTPLPVSVDNVVLQL